jgi:hypothetical protein
VELRAKQPLPACTNENIATTDCALSGAGEAKTDPPTASCGDVYHWILDPMPYKGQKCMVRFQVLQVIDERTVLLEIEGDYEMGRTAIFYGRLIPSIKLLDVVDGQRVAALVEIKGTKTYTTPTGATRTVPRMEIRHITVLMG